MGDGLGWGGVPTNIRLDISCFTNFFLTALTDRGPITNRGTLTDQGPLTDRGPLTDWGPLTDRDPLLIEAPRLQLQDPVLIRHSLLVYGASIHIYVTKQLMSDHLVNITLGVFTFPGPFHSTQFCLGWPRSSAQGMQARVGLRQAQAIYQFLLIATWVSNSLKFQ